MRAIAIEISGDRPLESKFSLYTFIYTNCKTNKNNARTWSASDENFHKQSTTHILVSYLFLYQQVFIPVQLPQTGGGEADHALFDYTHWCIEQ